MNDKQKIKERESGNPRKGVEKFGSLFRKIGRTI
jgi:hypothetical protein